MNTPLTWEQARDLANHVAAAFRAKIIYPNDVPSQIARAFVSALRAKSSEIDTVASLFDDLTSNTSVTTFVPAIGTVIVIAPNHAKDANTLAEVSTHEGEHAHDLQVNGFVQEATDYAGSSELRANAEGRAAAAGEVWMHYYLTGEVREASAPLESLQGWIYHLAPENVAEARAVLVSNAASARSGAYPQIESARVALAWLQEHAPDSIVPAHLRAKR